MKTNLKVIAAAIGVAVLASPALAQSESHPHAAQSAAGISNAHGSAANARGSVARTRTNLLGPGAANEGGQIRLDDCTHVAFPQCGGPGM